MTRGGIWCPNAANTRRRAIPEYWIVDPTQRSITVLTLNGQTYALHGEFDESSFAASVLLDGFTVSVTAVFSEVS